MANKVAELLTRAEFAREQLSVIFLHLRFDSEMKMKIQI